MALSYAEMTTVPDWFQRMWVVLHDKATWLNKLTEPKRTGPMAKILESKKFEFLVVAVILASVAFTIWSTNDTAMRIRIEDFQYEGMGVATVPHSFCSCHVLPDFKQDLRCVCNIYLQVFPLAVACDQRGVSLLVALNYAPILETCDRTRAGTNVNLTLYVEMGFCILLAVEVIARIAVHRWYFFVNENWGWNWFDFVLVFSAIMNLLYDQYLGYSIGNVTFLRAFRLMRVTRVLRVLRVVKFFRKLSEVLEALLTSIRAVAWVIALLSSLFLAFALIFVQLVSQYLYETDAMNECRQDLCECDMRDILACNPTEALVHYFGSVQQAMISLYMATTGGLDWANLWDVLIKTGFWNAMFFLLFTFLFIFCVFNLLTGLFVNQATNSAQQQKDMAIFEQRTKEKEHVEELQQICKAADKDNDGHISPKEFRAMMEDNHVLLWLASIGLDIADAKMFFDLMQTTSGASGKVILILKVMN